MCNDLCLFDIQFRRHVDLIRDVFAVLFPLTDALSEEIFDLTIHRAEVILCPGSKGIVELRIQTERDLLFRLCHLVQAAAVYDGLCITVAAQHHQKI